jgi:stage IV sporulation protein FB
VFYSPGPSEFDLRFRLFGFPITVSPMFWLSAALLGMQWFEMFGPSALATWIGVMFISILIHELGHALAARSLGYHPFISLYFLGGVASYEAGFVSPWRRVYVALMGPLAGFGLYFLCAGLENARLVPLSVTIVQLKLINWWWSLFNLLPVFPLDGGRILEGLTSAIVPRWSAQITHGLGAIVAAMIAIYGFTQKEPYLAVMFGLLCYTNIQMLQARRM